MTIYGLYIYESVLYGHELMNKGKNTNHTSTYDFRRTETFSITKFRLRNTSNQHHTSALRICNKFPAYLFNLSLSDLKRRVSVWLIQEAFYSLKEFYDLNNINV